MLNFLYRDGFHRNAESSDQTIDTPKCSLIDSTSLPGSLILPPRGASEERPWQELVACHCDNWKYQGGVLCNQAIGCVELCQIQKYRAVLRSTYPRCVTVHSVQAEISNICWRALTRQKPILYNSEKKPFSSLDPTIPLTCGRDRELQKDRGLWGREWEEANTLSDARSETCAVDCVFLYQSIAGCLWMHLEISIDFEH